MRVPSFTLFFIQENKVKPKKLLSQLFVTEQNNGMKYSTGLVKLLIRANQNIPEQLKSMAISAREVNNMHTFFNNYTIYSFTLFSILFLCLNE